MKTCTLCRLELPLEGFGKNRNQPDGKHYQCRSCVKEYQASYRQSDRGAAVSRAAQANWRGQRRDFLNHYKAERGCCKCGESAPIALDLHHLDPQQKEFNLGSLGTWEAMHAELGKCVVLCSNCHRKLHAGLLVL